MHGSFGTYSVLLVLEPQDLQRAVVSQSAEPFCDLNTNSGRLQASYLYNTYGVVALQHKDDKTAWGWFQRCLDIRVELLGEYEVNTYTVRGNQRSSF